MATALVTVTTIDQAYMFNADIGDIVDLHDHIHIDEVMSSEDQCYDLDALEEDWDSWDEWEAVENGMNPLEASLISESPF